MPDVRSGRLYIVRQLQVAGAVSTKVAGNHLLLSVTGRSVRCRSGSEISGAGLYERQGAGRRSRGMEGCGILDELIPFHAAIPAHVLRSDSLAGSSSGAASCFLLRYSVVFSPIGHGRFSPTPAGFSRTYKWWRFDPALGAVARRDTPGGLALSR